MADQQVALERLRELYREKNEHLEKFLEPVEPYEFYREIFPEGSFERKGHFEDRKGNGIAVTVPKGEEYDGCGRYRVHMAVENAFGVFAKGEEDYLLIVQQEQGQETPVICYYEPMEKIAYNYSEDRDDPACEMALLFLQAEGGMRFNGSFWLDRATATDFALTMLYAENEGKTAFAAEEVTAAAQKYMGLTGFAPDESYLGAEGYILPGRAARRLLSNVTRTLPGV